MSMKLHRLSQLALTQKRDETTDDILRAMPFLLPVLGVGATDTARARKSARGTSFRKLSVRGVSSRALPSPHNPETPTPGLNTSSGSGDAALKLVAKDYKLSPEEAELAVRAWFQHHADNSLLNGDEEGGGKASAVQLTAHQLVTVALSSTKHSISAGKDLMALMKGLHVPVAHLVEPLLDDVLYLINETPGAVQLAGATARSGAGRKPAMHFYHFLRFLQCCKHLTALQRHREAAGRRAILPASKRFVFAPRITGEEELSGGGFAEPPGEQLDATDFHDAFMYIARECSDPEATTVTCGADIAPLSITALALSKFAESFVLAPSAFLPRHFVEDAKTIETPLTSDRKGSVAPLMPQQSRSLKNLALDKKLEPVQQQQQQQLPPPKPTGTVNAALLDQRVTLDDFREAVLNERPSGTSTLRWDTVREREDLLSPKKIDDGAAMDAAHANKHASKGDEGKSHAARMRTLERQFNKSLKPFATRLERFSPFSTAQQPPSTYLQFLVSRETKEEADAKRVAAEKDAVDAWYHPAPVVAPKVPLDELAQQQLQKLKDKAQRTRGGCSPSPLVPAPTRSEPIASPLAVCAAKNLLEMLQQAPQSSLLASPERMLALHEAFARGGSHSPQARRHV